MGKDIPADGDLGCVVSGAFPYYQADATAIPTLFFPKPVAYTIPTTDNTQIKKMKKVAWLDKYYLEQVLNGQELSGADIQNHVNGSYLTNQSFEPFIDSQVNARVTVSRSGEDAKPFYMDAVYFKGHSGLFFLAEGDTSLIDEVLPLLAQEGVGTDRNVGHGYFEYKKEHLEIQVPDSADLGLILSTFIPEDKLQLEQAIDNPHIAYELVRRGGWITSAPYNTLRKNAIYAFAAGSVLSGNLLGKIVDLAPKGMVNHPIWRCGKTIVLPIKL
jgi:CRISPR-associated protein Csm4